MSSNPKSENIQGEGDYEAARRYDKQAHDFAKSGKVDKAAKEAKPDNAAQAKDLKRAEEAGKSRAKG
tara:strand:- start:3044 stop:3244 length:201 start_codon:yes stop_codon:yes gene_type:complete